MQIDGVEINKGESKRFGMVVSKQFDGTDITIPIEVIRGKDDGPTMFISAALHGDEINGVEVIRRLMSRKKLLSNIKGTLITIPIVNIFGFYRNVRYFPDRRDINRVFPGSKNGSLTSQVARKFVSEIVQKCNYGIDLHTSSAHRYNLPYIKVLFENEEMKSIAKSFGVPVVLKGKVLEGSLRQVASDMGVKMLLFEGGEALRHDEKAIEYAERGIISTLSKIGMLDKDLLSSKFTKTRKVIFSELSHWIRAQHSGTLHKRKQVGAKVKKGEIIGVIYYGTFRDKKYYVRSKWSGIIISVNMMPLVNNGNALFHIALCDTV